MRILQAAFDAGQPGEDIARHRLSPAFAVRTVVGRGAGLAGVVLYNWWIAAAATGMMSSTNDFFSDLEADGQRHAALFSHLDVLAGVLIVLALILRGPWATSGRRADWACLVAFAAAAILGGLFPYSCAEGLDAACRTAEWSFRLPLRHYVHIAAGICEFAAASAAIASAWRRTTVGVNRSAVPVRALGWVLMVFYPALAIAYLTDRFGAFVEPAFFTVFSMMVIIEVFERQPAQNSIHGPDRTNG